MKRSVLFLISVLLAIPSFACECITHPVRTRYLAATKMFVGKVISRETKVVGGIIDPTAELTVSRWFAGGNEETVKVHVDSSCGELYPGHEYLVFAECDSEGRINHRGCATYDLSEKYGIADLKKLRHRVWLWRLERPVWRRLHGVTQPKCSSG
jgi:hypothetical protein